MSFLFVIHIMISLSNNGFCLPVYGQTLLEQMQRSICFMYFANNNTNWIYRRKQRKSAIYPKFTIEQLEQMLAMDKAKYKRCKINIKNWFSAEAVPLSDEGEENLPDDLSNETDKSSSDNGKILYCQCKLF